MARKAKPIEKVKFAAADIVMRKIDELKPFPNNPKIHTPAQVDAIAANITAFGFDQPILIDETDTILKGHGRQLGARKAGLELVPTIARAGLSADDKWAIVISDNALPAMTGFDRKLLTVGLTQLAKVNYPLSLTGFDQVRLAMFGVGGDAGIAGDPNAEMPMKPAVSKKGDVWIMDGHRIVCGDCTDAVFVAEFFDGDQPGLVVTDPPYGVSLQRGKWVGPTRKARGGRFRPIEGDDLRGDTLKDMVVAALAPVDWDAAFYCWSPPLREGLTLLEAMTESDIRVQSQIIWNKSTFALGRADYQWKHEICWYGFRGEHHAWYGGRDKTTVWDIARLQAMKDHPTQKPVDCMKLPIENSSKPGDFVYDPFLGSGTTLIAAAMTNRHCLGMDVSPEYVDVAVRRWQAMTKKPATLQATGKSFEQVVRERAKRAA